MLNGMSNDRAAADLRTVIAEPETEWGNRRGEETLGNTERRFRALVQHSSDTIAVLAVDGTILYISPAITSLAGVLPETITGTSMFDLVHPDDVPLIRSTMDRLVAEAPTTSKAVHRLLRVDGTWITAESVGQNLLADSSVGGLVFYIRDITESFQAAETLGRRAQQQETVARFGQFALGAHSVEMLRDEAIDVTLRTLAAAGAALCELLPGERQLLITAGRADSWHVRIGSIIEVDQQSQVGYTVLVKVPVRSDDIQNDTRFHRLNVIPAPNFLSSMSVHIPGGSAPFGVLIVHSTERFTFSDDDVHFLQAIANIVATAIGRLRFETTISASEEKYRRIVETTTDGIATSDSLTRITFANRQLVDMLGYRDDELIGLRVQDLMSSESAANAGTRLEQARQGVKLQIELQLRRKDGIVLPVWVNSNPLLDSDGTYQGALSTVTDLSGRRDLEAQLRQAQKLEAIGQLAGGVAHDFNNLLTVIMGYGELIGETTLTEEQRHAITQIRQAGESAASLTRQLLAFSRQQVIAPRELDLNATVEHLGHMLRRLIGEDIVFATRLTANLGAIRADPGQVEQILLNLATNARDAMPRGGQLMIETANVEFDAAYANQHADTQPGPYVMLSVSDTGIGMDATVQARIFEPFFTTKGVGEGTGLGLAAVHGIVKQSGGSIGVYSEVGIGTTFKLYFPRIQTPAVETVAIAPAKHARGTETILVAEDDPRLRAFIKVILRGDGYTILEAGDGVDALAVAEQHAGSIDLLVTDVVMPKLGGRLLAERLLVRSPTLKVIYVSGYTDDMVVRHGVVNASVEFLQKPFTSAGLSEKVRQVLDVP